MLQSTLIGGNFINEYEMGGSREVLQFKNETWTLVGHTHSGRELHAVSVVDYDDIQTTCDVPESSHYIKF